MRASEIFFSIVALFLCFLFLLLGLIFLYMPFDRALLSNVATLASLPSFYRWSGWICLVLGILLLFIFNRKYSRQYLLVKMGGKRAVSMEERVFQALVEKVMKNVFPGVLVPCSIVIHRRKKVEVVVGAPFVPFEERDEKLEQIETFLHQEFSLVCGYNRSFILNVQFKNE